MNLIHKILVAFTVVLASSAHAQHDPGTPDAVASRIDLRGYANGVKIPEMRVVRRNDILVVQADMLNTLNGDRTVFYRFRWLDSIGSQVGDGESWKQMRLMGQAQQTVKSVAPTSNVTDFRLEMNVEPN